MKSIALIGVLILAGTGTSPALAADEPQTHMHGTDSHMEHSAAAAKMYSGHGRVNSVDVAAGKVNIAHDPITELKWPRMTMDFQASTPTLKNIKQGIEVVFELQKMEDGYHIVKIAPARPSSE
jgi:Cu(I)/Ag(I) efflux system protein CusF